MFRRTVALCVLFLPLAARESRADDAFSPPASVNGAVEWYALESSMDRESAVLRREYAQNQVRALARLKADDAVVRDKVRGKSVTFHLTVEKVEAERIGLKAPRFYIKVGIGAGAMTARQAASLSVGDKVEVTVRIKSISFEPEGLKQDHGDAWHREFTDMKWKLAKPSE